MAFRRERKEGWMGACITPGVKCTAHGYSYCHMYKRKIHSLQAHHPTISLHVCRVWRGFEN